ncbi:MAG: hypothetical protein KDE46_02170 [Caldilineaceae bacterium]|nr:hypothetical protein [Caldilineaceae bacterium]
MKKLLFYCQHVLGMGHLMRSMALVNGLVDEFSVAFLNGGEMIPGFEFPPSVEVINLPPLKSDAQFTGIQALNGQSLREIKTARAALMLETFERIQPDVLMIELFPFGRKKFGFELMPLLAKIRLDYPKTKVLCSLRDIMVSRRDQWKHEARACRIINRYFDAVLIHADPAFQRLDESFGAMNELQKPVIYTGYVAQQTEPKSEGVPADEPEIPVAHPLILASIGGGRVGVELLQGAVAVSHLLAESLPHQLLIFTGPYLPDADYAQLEAQCANAKQIVLRRYTNRFLHYMAQADLSISMAGYNTCMNLLTTNTKALVLPFTGGDNDEQSTRAQKLANMGLVGILQPINLHPETLATRIAMQLLSGSANAQLDLNGVAATVATLKEITDTRMNSDDSKLTSQPPSKIAAGDASSLRTPDQRNGYTNPLDAQLRLYLDQLAKRTGGGSIHMFLRDDDINEDEDTLRQLLDISLARGVPVNLEVIPGSLTDAGARLIADHKRFTPHLIELDQHGWIHANHEVEGRKCEFGVSRSYAQQLDDIARGKALLEATFDELFSPVFTPPWNRCTPNTYQVLHDLGFRIFSGMTGQAPVIDYAFRDLSVTLDLYRWKGNPKMKAPQEIVADLIGQIEAGAPIGLLLHHKVMDDAAFSFLDELLRTLRAYPFVHFHTFESLARQVPSLPMLQTS